MTLVESLRKYVGEQVPPEVQSQAWEPERKELLDTVQVRQGWPGGESTAPREGGHAVAGLRLPTAWV